MDLPGAFHNICPGPLTRLADEPATNPISYLLLLTNKAHMHAWSGPALRLSTIWKHIIQIPKSYKKKV